MMIFCASGAHVYEVRYALVLETQPYWPSPAQAFASLQKDYEQVLRLLIGYRFAACQEDLLAAQ